MVTSLLIIALIIPLVTIIRVHSDEIQLTLHYKYTYSHRYGGEGDVTSTSEAYEVSAAADLDNLSLVLRDEEVRGYPVWMNVSTWKVGNTIQLVDQEFTVISSPERYGFDCWEAETHDGTRVYYHKELGVFLGSSYWDPNWLGGTDWAWTSRDIDVTYQNLDDFYAVDYMLNSDAVLLSIIIVESVILMGLSDRRRIKGLTVRKS